MKSCKTSIARSMGYLSRPSIEEDIHGGSVHVLGPASGEMTSYHAGETSRAAYVAARAAFTALGGKRRVKRTVLFAK